jgi:uncharacterized membrane protein
MNFRISSRIANNIFAFIMLIFGIMHIFGTGQMSSIVPLPFQKFWVIFTGLALIAYAISVFIQHRLSILAGYLLAAMLVIFIFSVHLPVIIRRELFSELSVIMALKDLALAAAAIVIANQKRD